MLATANTFVLAILIGVIIGSVNAYFRYWETRSRRASVRTFLAWVLAFTVTGVIATPIARWLLHNVL